MAAAIIPLVAAAVTAIGPQIPAIVQAVEGLFGNSAQTGQPAGAQKMDAAVTALQSLLVSLANAGKIPSAPVVDPSLIPGLAGAVQSVVDALKAQGQLGAAPTTGTPTPAKPQPFTPVSTGVSWVFTGTAVQK